MFDIKEFLKVATPTAAALLPLVLAWVTWLRTTGVPSKWLPLASMISGLVLGSATMYAQLGAQSTFAGWFMIVLFGLIVGLGASGVYDTGAQLVSRSVEKTLINGGKG